MRSKWKEQRQGKIQSVFREWGKYSERLMHYCEYMSFD